MFRCHFTRGGHIAMGENLDSVTLDEAIAAGKKLLADSAVADRLDGIEIWDCATFLYASADEAEPLGSNVRPPVGAFSASDAGVGRRRLSGVPQKRRLLHSQLK